LFEGGEFGVGHVAEPLRDRIGRKMQIERLRWATRREGEMRRATVVTCITILWAAFAGSGVAHAADAQGTNTRPSMALPAFTFATLPPATADMLAYISDGLAANCGDAACTTFGTAVTGGGGALKLFVWADGSHWTLKGK
jgi:hypothetical protein